MSRHPRVQLRFKLTSNSCMNQVETWFSLLARGAIRREAFERVRALHEVIQRFLEAWNEDCQPFEWVKSAQRSY